MQHLSQRGNRQRHQIAQEEQKKALQRANAVHDRVVALAGGAEDLVFHCILKPKFRFDWHLHLHIYYPLPSSLLCSSLSQLARQEENEFIQRKQAPRKVKGEISEVNEASRRYDEK